jgi:hypothetical protein
MTDSIDTSEDMAQPLPAGSPTPTQEAATVEGLRDEFERRVRENPADPPGLLLKDEDGDYRAMIAHVRWSEFQAGAAYVARLAGQQQQPVAWRQKVEILNGYSYNVVFHESTKTGEGWEPLYASTPPALPLPEPSALNFICYLIDNCEGQKVYEEALHGWLSAFMKDPKYAATPSPTGQAPGQTLGWAHEDGRVISAQTKSTAERDGGASASSVKGYTIRLVAAQSLPAVPAEVSEYPEAYGKDVNDAIIKMLELFDYRTTGDELTRARRAFYLTLENRDLIAGQRAVINRMKADASVQPATEAVSEAQIMRAWHNLGDDLQRVPAGKYDVLTFAREVLKLATNDLAIASDAVLKASEKACRGTPLLRWAGFENGRGEECGTELDKALSDLSAALSQKGAQP